MDPTLMIGDIVEHDIVSQRKDPTDFSDLAGSTTGFPQHKRRWKNSTSRTKTNEITRGSSTPHEPHGIANHVTFEESERQRIDQENRQKLDSMSSAEIAKAQEDLMNGLNPALIQRLLRRANIDETPDNSPFDAPGSKSQERSTSPPHAKVEDMPPSLDQLEKDSKAQSKSGVNKSIPANYDEDAAPVQIPPDLFPISNPPKSTHFPVPPKQPDIDPSDPDFLARLHDKYFPDLPADPSSLAWMAPVPSADSTADKQSPYYPHPEIAVSALRFDFRGRFLPPRLSRTISSTKGLHHHGEAPEAAGYTVAELARLARSAVPAQRCMSFQTLGRILYRLGKGEWGQTEDDPIAAGVWGAMKEGRVLETLAQAAMADGGHRSSQAYATEALWLFEKGGWKETFKGR